MKYTQEQELEWINSMPTKRVSASVVLTNDQKEILIVKPNYRDYWNLPGGVVEENESPLDGALREVSEETDLNLDKLEVSLLGVQYIPAHGPVFKEFLAFLFDGGTLSKEQCSRIKIQEDELDDYKFIKESELKDYLNIQTYNRISQSYGKGLHSVMIQ